MRPTFALAALVLLTALLPAQPAGHDLAFFLPGDVAYDEALPTPRAVLGTQVGEWHARPDQIVRYYEVLARRSDRMRLQVYAHTHEDRPLLLATFTSPDNLARLAELREQHVEAVRAGRDPGPEAPTVVWLGYSVHGDEPSGANASLLTAYHLAAARGPAVDALLADTIVLVDPVINPDGLARFATWANMHKGERLVASRHHREHRQGWPSGRTNHYWFDLNRDWLLLTHPESRGRIEQFHRWRPHVLTDHHEMGTDATFFFQPGVPSRQNPRTPARNLALTRAIARHHAEALDELGVLYYSEERFDDFYYGKGSTYPDVHGSIGILFEQASSRGHLQENARGPLDFPTTIRNQLATTLSTLEAARALRRELAAYQAETIRTALDEAAVDPVAAFVFGDAADAARVHAMADILRRHAIEVHALAEDVTVDGTTFHAGGGLAYAVQTDQPQYRLVRSLFETRTSFPDDTFYDVSTWTFPLAFGLSFAELDATQAAAALGARIETPEPPRGPPPVDAEGTYAYLVDWRGYYAPRAVARLLEAGVHARVATRPLSVRRDGEAAEQPLGTVVVPLGTQTVARERLLGLLATAAREDGVRVTATTTGLTPTGVDLGSPSLEDLEMPHPVLLVGDGVSAYEAGEAWHLLDTRYGVPVVLLETDRLGRGALEDATHLLVVGGSYSLSESTLETVRGWVRSGGVLVASGRAARWARRAVLGRDDEPSDDEESDGPPAWMPERPAYGDYQALRAKQLVSGAIFETRLDTTHPIAFGATSDRLPVFRRDATPMPLEEDPFVNVAVYTEAPLLSGYASDENVERLAGTAAVVAERLGRGAVIRIADDPNFRGFWYGTNRLYANALFFGHVLDRTSALGDEAGAARQRAR